MSLKPEGRNLPHLRVRSGLTGEWPDRNARTWCEGTKTLPKKEEMISELNDPKGASQMRMHKGPLRMLSLKDSFKGATRAEARFQGFE